MHLLESIKGLSLTSGAVVVGVLSAVIAIATSWLKQPLVRWGALLVIPFMLANLLYWSPVIFGDSSSTEYFAWALICVVPWSIVGMFASVVVALVSRRFIKAKPDANA